MGRFYPRRGLGGRDPSSATAIDMGDKLGTVEPGKVADLAAFDGDLTVDVTAFSRVVAVFQAGQRVH